MKKYILLTIGLWVVSFSLASAQESNHTAPITDTLNTSGATPVIAPAITETTESKPMTPFFDRKGIYRRWSIGANVGGMTPKGIGGTPQYNVSDVNLAYGGYLQNAITHAFNIKAAVQRGKISGSYDAALAKEHAPVPATESFSTDITAAVSGLVQVDASALLYRKQTSFAVFFETGGGLMFYKPNSGGNDKASFIPLNVGMKIRLTDRITLEGAYNTYFSNKSNISYAETKKGGNNVWSQGYVGLNYNVGSKHKKNLDWSNPYAYMYDEIKANSLRPEVIALQKKVDEIDAAIQAYLIDSDGDGVPDIFDKEPNTPPGTQVDGAGRTIIFPVYEYNYEGEGGEYEYGQGNNAGSKLSNSQNELIKSIRFVINSDKLTAKSRPAINELAQYLIHTGNKIIIKGYTSDDGPYEYNMDLSRRRANSVKRALVQQGVKAANIMTFGYGPADPIAPNDTEVGREQNRRVEIILQQ